MAIFSRLRRFRKHQLLLVRVQLSNKLLRNFHRATLSYQGILWILQLPGRGSSPYGQEMVRIYLPGTDRFCWTSKIQLSTRPGSFFRLRRLTPSVKQISRRISFLYKFDQIPLVRRSRHQRLILKSIFQEIQTLFMRLILRQGCSHLFHLTRMIRPLMLSRRPSRFLMPTVKTFC